MRRGRPPSGKSKAELERERRARAAELERVRERERKAYNDWLRRLRTPRTNDALDL